MTDVLVAIADGGIRPIAFHVLLVGLTCAAWLHGNSLIRLAATGWLAACLLSDVASAHSLHRFTNVEPVLLVIDVVTLVFLIWLTLREPCVWLTCAAAFQLIATSSHFVMGGGPSIAQWVYQIFVYGSGWGTTLALAVGQSRIAEKRIADAQHFLLSCSSHKLARQAKT